MIIFVNPCSHLLHLLRIKTEGFQKFTHFRQIQSYIVSVSNSFQWHCAILLTEKNAECLGYTDTADLD